MTKRIIAISGSLRDQSSTGAVVRLVRDLASHDVDVAIYDGLGDLPHFSPDLDSDEHRPASVTHLRSLLRDAHALLICTPEYAHGMPGSLKNLLDWLVSAPELVGMRVAALSASPSGDGGRYAHAWLVQTLTVMSTNIVSTLIIPFVKKRLGEGDPGLREELAGVVATLTAPS